MDPVIPINVRVDVVPLFLKQGNINQLCMPQKMKYKNEVITFTKIGLRHPTVQGKRMIHVFDMSDGINDYRLEFDAEALTWTLISMIAGGS